MNPAVPILSAAPLPVLPETRKHNSIALHGYGIMGRPDSTKYPPAIWTSKDFVDIFASSTSNQGEDGQSGYRRSNDHEQETGTRVDEVAAGIYRICTPLDVIPGGFTFNSYLVVDEEPLLHAGYRKLFPVTLEAITKVMPVGKLRWIGGSRFEGDEFARWTSPGSGAGSHPVWQSHRRPDVAERFRGEASPRAGGRRRISIRGQRMKWLYTPHVPHGWDCGSFVRSVQP